MATAVLDDGATVTYGTANTLRLAVLQGDGPVLLRAMGGRRPLTFLVDGAPVPGVPAQRQASWAPDGPGFYFVTVLDADRASTHVGMT